MSFGSHAIGDLWAGSDLDVAVLLPPGRREPANLFDHPARVGLEQAVRRDVDLVNLRTVSVVLQKEVVLKGRRVFCADTCEVEEFELGVMSRYQKLNDERADIVRAFDETGVAVST
ncbi:MAG: nucleotidyltransferase domain-containing protein [Gammaproteobacteria bacterium]|nr:nucleotidyltransferase domain-containing protein [Gammaproteobacteria bacterium]